MAGQQIIDFTRERVVERWFKEFDIEGAAGKRVYHRTRRKG